VNGVGLSGSFLVRDRKLFSVLPVGLRKFRQSTLSAVSVSPGMGGLQLMTSRRWMRMGNLSSLVSGVAVILIVSIHHI
jgi:hypothetical protein